MNTNMFEMATRNKYRFPFKGMITVEDLWDLTVNSLDTVFKALNAEKKRTQEESLLDTKSHEDEILLTKIEIVKHIVSVKLAEIEKAKNEKAKAELKQKIMEIKAKRQDAAFENMSDEDLDKALTELSE